MSEDCQMARFSTTWLRLLRRLFELFLGFLDSKSAEITFRKRETVSVLSYLAFCNELHIWECPGFDYLPSHTTCSSLYLYTRYRVL